jgi:hypothetical protein
MVDGTAYYMAVSLLAGDVVSNIHVAISTGGASLTLSKAGLYTLAGAQLAVSADQGTAWQSAGTKAAAMGTPYTVPTSGLYYAGIVSKGGTLPTLLRGFSNTLAAAATAIGSGVAPTGAQTGQTDLVDPATITAASGIAYWVGVS